MTRCLILSHLMFAGSRTFEQICRGLECDDSSAESPLRWELKSLEDLGLVQRVMAGTYEGTLKFKYVDGRMRQYEVLA